MPVVGCKTCTRQWVGAQDEQCPFCASAEQAAAASCCCGPAEYTLTWGCDNEEIAADIAEKALRAIVEKLNAILGE